MQVLAAREAQVEEKMRAVKAEQEESLQRREELLRDVERANQLTRREDERREQAKTARKAELESQVTKTTHFYCNFNARAWLCRVTSC